MGVADIGNPITHRLVDRFLERSLTGGDTYHLSSKKAHAGDIQCLALHINCSHVNAALKTKACCRRGCGDAVLASPCLGDNPLLAHAPSEQDLAEGVIDLVSAGMKQVFAL